MEIEDKDITFDEFVPIFMKGQSISLSHKAYVCRSGKNKVFSNWLKANGYDKLPLRQITDDIMYSFFIYLAKDKNLDRTTCKQYAISLKLTFRFALKFRYITYMPFDLLVFPPKKESKSAIVIPKDDLRFLLKFIRAFDKQLYLACMMQYYCFIRPNELRLLKIKDINFKQGTITIPQDIAKNKLEESVTIPEQLIDILKEYELEKYPKEFYIFGKKKRPGDIPFSINMMRWRFNKIKVGLGFPKRYKFYSMKHTGATTIHNSKKVSLRDLMDQLRHKHLNATEHYIQKHSGSVNENIKFAFESII